MDIPELTFNSSEGELSEIVYNTAHPMDVPELDFGAMCANRRAREQRKLQRSDDRTERSLVVNDESSLMTIPQIDWKAVAARR